MRKKIVSALLIATVASSLPVLTFAGDRSVTSPKASLVQVSSADFIVNGKISGWTSFSVLNDYGQIVTTGESDSKGIFTLAIPESSVQNSKHLILNYNGVSVEQKIIPNAGFIVFSQAEETQQLLLGIDPISDIGTFIYGKAMDALKKNVIGPMVDDVFRYLGIPVDDGPSATDIKLDKLSEQITELNGIVTSNFKYIEQQLYNLYNQAVKADMSKLNARLSFVNSKVNLITNVGSSDKYAQFMEASGYNRIPEKDATPLVIEAYWKEILSYDKKNGFENDIDSMTYVLKEKVSKPLDKEEYKVDVLISKLNEIDGEVDDLISSDKPVVEEFSAVSKSSIGVDIEDGYDLAKPMNLCYGVASSYKYNSYATALATILNVYALESITSSNATPSTGSDIITGLAKSTQKYMHCDYFGNGSGSAWPEVTYQPIMRDGAPFLIVFIPIDLEKRVGLPEATDLADIKSYELREEKLSVIENQFFKELSQHVDSLSKANYTSGKDYLVAEYKLKDTYNIDNSVLFSSSKDDVKTDVSCYYNKCTFKVSNVPDNRHSFHIIEGNEYEADLVEGNNTISYAYEILGKDAYEAKRESVIIQNANGRTVESIKMPITMPLVPEYYWKKNNGSSSTNLNGIPGNIQAYNVTLNNMPETTATKDCRVSVAGDEVFGCEIYNVEYGVRVPYSERFNREGDYIQGGGKILYTTGKFKQWLTFKNVNIYWPLSNDSITLKGESWGEFKYAGNDIVPDDNIPDDNIPDDNIEKGFSLAENEYLKSSNGVYKLGISPLSLTDSSGNKYWEPTAFVYTVGQMPIYGTSLVLQDDGNLVLTYEGKVKWASNTVGSGATKLVLQSDGNLVLYNNRNSPVWSTNTAR